MLESLECGIYLLVIFMILFYYRFSLLFVVCIGGILSAKALAIEPYGGLALGFQASRFTIDIDDNNFALGALTKRGAVQQSFLGGIQLGFEHLIKDQFVLGLELEGLAGDNETEVRRELQARDLLERIKRSYALGIAVRLGYKINKWNILARLGAEWSTFSIFSQNATNIPRKNIIKRERQAVGFVPGVELSYDFSPVLNIGLNYRYAMYKSFKITQKVDNLAGFLYTKIHPRYHYVLFSIKWKFRDYLFKK